MMMMTSPKMNSEAPSPSPDEHKLPPKVEAEEDDKAKPDAKQQDSPPKSKDDENPKAEKKSNDDDAAAGDDSSLPQPQDATFPQQLMDVIESETTAKKDVATLKDGERVLEWLPEGDSFVIRDKRMLERDVLPKYFSARCKFMSFVRKLYRWGFRQVEKNIPNCMIFMHANFVRGDKQRCLMMRSIVKKSNQKGMMGAGPGDMAGQQASLQQQMQMQNLQALGMAGGFNPGMLRALQGSAGGMGGQFGGLGGMGMGGMEGLGGMLGGMGGMGNMNMNTLAPMSQNTRQVSFPGSSSDNQGLMNSQGNSNGPSSLFGGGGGGQNQFGQGSSGMGGMTSKDMFEAGLRLERMEREQRQMQMMDSMGNGNSGVGPMGGQMGGGGGGNNAPSSGGLGGGAPQGGGGGDAGMNQVDLASQLMKRDPGMEPWRALELAKRFQS